MIYSTQFYAGQPPGDATTALFTVPSGHVYVVRDITVTPFSAGSPDRFTILIGGSAAGFLASDVTTPEYQSWHQEGRWVLEAGQVCEFHSDGRTYRVLISGYDLVQL